MKTQPQHKQQQTNMINTPRPNNNKSYNDNDNKSKFVRTRNQNKDIPVSASKIRKRIRDVKRTLTKGKESGKVSAQVITESKRRLRALEYELGEKVVDEAEKNNLNKYHKVKHFERKKAERKLKQARRELDEKNDPVKEAELQSKVDALQINLLYVLHYPKTVPYVSLYPKENIDDIKSILRKQKLLNDIGAALLAGDHDLTLMNKKYRNEYKEKLIQKGIIKADEPVAVDEDVDTTMEDKKADNDNSSSGEDDDEEEQDDFFEKA